MKDISRGLRQRTSTQSSGCECNRVAGVTSVTSTRLTKQKKIRRTVRRRSVVNKWVLWTNEKVFYKPLSVSMPLGRNSLLLQCVPGCVVIVGSTLSLWCVLGRSVVARNTFSFFFFFFFVSLSLSLSLSLSCLFFAQCAPGSASQLVAHLF